MTNGEKIKELFPHFDVEDKTEYFGRLRNLDDHFIKADIDFWNAEYKESTTKDDHHKQNIQAYAHDFGVSEEQAEKELRVTTKNDLGVDLVSREDVLKLMQDNWHTHNGDWAMQESMDDIRALPSATPQEPRKGEWLRMSDLSEQEDYRYKCSRCGNVIKHKSKMDLYTFNSWCGRCGSDNGRKIEVEA